MKRGVVLPNNRTERYFAVVTVRISLRQQGVMAFLYLST